MAISTMRLSETTKRCSPLDNSGRYPDGVVQVVSVSCGLTRDEMRECVRDGRAEAERIRAAERLAAPQEPTTMIDWWGAEEAVPRSAWLGGACQRLRGKQVVQRPSGEGRWREMTHHLTERGDRGGGRPQGCLCLASRGEGELWLVCESSGPTGYELGVEVDMGALSVQRGSRGLHLVRAGQYVCVELVRARDLESWQRRRQLLGERSGGMETFAGELLRERPHGAEPGAS